MRRIAGAAPRLVVRALLAAFVCLAWPALAGADASLTRITYPLGHFPQLPLGKGETHPVHSVLNVTRRLTFGDYVWDARGIPAGRVWVRIDLARQMASVFRGNDEIGTAVILYGTPASPTPIGRFAVLAKNKDYYSHTYDAPMPYALRITADGVALHASSVRDHWATHGCIGMPLNFARLLYDAMNLGDSIVILPAHAGPNGH